MTPFLEGGLWWFVTEEGETYGPFLTEDAAWDQWDDVAYGQEHR